MAKGQACVGQARSLLDCLMDRSTQRSDLKLFRTL